MTIHSDHPFATPEHDRDPLRRLRGRMPAPVTVWATGDGANREGWTVSSLLVAEGDDGSDGRGPVVVGLLDEDSELAAEVAGGTTLCISLLTHDHRDVADAFARVAPAPGGPFRVGEWEPTAWGPRLVGAAGWLGVRVSAEPTYAGWALLVTARVEHAEIADGTPMAHVRGRYVDLSRLGA
ncbi:hypothetical protein GCM10027418_03440 [Mariniluteicoccus endophyticus]